MRRIALAAVLLAAAWGTVMAQTPAEAKRIQAPDVIAHHDAVKAHRGVRVGEDRVALLTAELNLTPAQQVAVRNILQAQREDQKRAWADPDVPAAYRVNATRRLNERTADQIRAILTEEQRKKYALPQPAPEQPDGSRPSVEQLMKSTQSR